MDKIYHAMINWQHYLPENTHILPHSLKNLMQSSSLTKELSQYTAAFDVELRYLGLLPYNQQTLTANSNANSLHFVREVFLRLDHIPVVWAISICNKDAVFWPPILNRGKQSLGDFLFEKQATEIKRSTIEFSYKKHDLCPNKQILWARRSVFEYNSEELNLQEIFLPTLFDFI